jgi:hypothetical protein
MYVSGLRSAWLALHDLALTNWFVVHGPLSSQPFELARHPKEKAAFGLPEIRERFLAAGFGFFEQIQSELSRGI